MIRLFTEMGYVPTNPLKGILCTKRIVKNIFVTVEHFGYETHFRLLLPNNHNSLYQKWFTSKLIMF